MPVVVLRQLADRVEPHVLGVGLRPLQQDPQGHLVGVHVQVAEVLWGPDQHTQGLGWGYLSTRSHYISSDAVVQRDSQ